MCVCVCVCQVLEPKSKKVPIPDDSCCVVSLSEILGKDKEKVFYTLVQYTQTIITTAHAVSILYCAHC